MSGKSAALKTGYQVAGAGKNCATVTVSDEEMAALQLTHRKLCPHWNDILYPRT